MPCLASFQNSRVKPRKATETADTAQLDILVTETVVRAPNPNRTYLTLRNLDATNPIYYGYPSDFGNLLAQGFQLKGGDAVDIESTQEIRAIALGGTVKICLDEGQG